MDQSALAKAAASLEQASERMSHAADLVDEAASRLLQYLERETAYGEAQRAKKMEGWAPPEDIENETPVGTHYVNYFKEPQFSPEDWSKMLAMCKQGPTINAYRSPIGTAANIPNPLGGESTEYVAPVTLRKDWVADLYGLKDQASQSDGPAPLDFEIEPGIYAPFGTSMREARRMRECSEKDGLWELNATQNLARRRGEVIFEGIPRKQGWPSDVVGPKDYPQSEVYGEPRPPIARNW